MNIIATYKLITWTQHKKYLKLIVSIYKNFNIKNKKMQN